MAIMSKCLNRYQVRLEKILKLTEKFCMFMSITYFFLYSHVQVPVPVAARSKVWVCGCLPPGNAGSNSSRGHECLL